MSELHPPNLPATSCPWSGAAALYVLGALPPDERDSFAAHLTAGCRPCTQEHEQIAREVAEVDLAALSDADASVPSPRLRERLMVDIEGRAPAEQAPERSWQRWNEGALPGALDPAGLRTVAGGERGFEPTAFAGIQVKPLSVDEARRCVTMLVRMGAKSSYPPHRHSTREECFVLSGELSVGERVLRQGDYQVAEAGSTHGVQSSEQGCLLLIVSSQDDVLV